ncbi:hypothetical protein EDD16DRAFT_1520257 [Pisolithus croceorrhizus]|nr:hypothetical protein EDD16DRAFT_1520257 [Pisolithus croceorrhizus]
MTQRRLHHFLLCLLTKLKLFGRTSNLKSSGLLADESSPQPIRSRRRSTPSNSSEEERMGSSDDKSPQARKAHAALINEHLDTTKCLSAQDPALLKVVHQKAVDKFLDLEDYSNCWPVNDIIMMQLKYTSSCTRWQETEMAASKKKKAKMPTPHHRSWPRERE